jgi:DNA-binding NarL/FixJ family response regulator
MNMHPTSLTPYRILIVDDIAAVRESLRWLIENEGDLMVVGEAGNGIEAMRCAEVLQPDLILMDIEMPLSNGYQTAQNIKRLENPPCIIFLSIHSLESHNGSSWIGEGDSFIGKSEGWPALLRQIRSMQGREQ